MSELFDPWFSIPSSNHSYLNFPCVTGLLPPRSPTGPGEMGKAVVIPAEMQEESKQKFKIHQFNLLASEMMSLNRSLPDHRMSG